MMTGNVESDSDEQWIEDEIQRELDQLDVNALSTDDEQCATERSQSEFNDEHFGVKTIEDGMVPSMLEYISLYTKQTDKFERELNECDELLQQAELVSARLTEIKDDTVQAELQAAAVETGLDIEALKRKILFDIENDDDTDETASVLATDRAPAEVAENGDGYDAPCKSEALELELKRNLYDLQEKQQLLETERKRNDEVMRAEMKEKQRKLDEQWAQKRLEMEEDRRKVDLENELRQQQLAVEKLELQKKMEKTLQNFEVEMEQLSEKLRVEKEQFERAREEENARQQQKKFASAVRIQAVYRGFRCRKQFGTAVEQRRGEGRRLVQERRQKEAEALEEERRMAAEEQKRKEEEEKRLQEEKKRLEEEAEQRRKAEELKRKDEEERKKLEEKQRKEEERQRKEEEKRRKEEEKRQKKEEEERRKAEEKARKEEEKRRKEEEKRQAELRKKEEEERLREQKRIQEEEWKRKEEEERQKIADEIKQKVEAKLRLEAEERRKLEERMKAEAEEHRKLEEKVKLESVERVKLSNNPTVVGPSVVLPEMSENSQMEVAEKVENFNQLSACRQSNESRKSPRNDAGMRRSPQKRVPDGGGDVASAVGGENGENCSESENKSIEKRRLAWMKECEPWSKLSRKPIAKSTQKIPRRPSATRSLAQLSEMTILTSANVSALQQVTTLELHDLPGCNVATLSRCINLKSLVLNDCGIVAADDLGSLSSLQYVDLRRNNVEMLNLCGATRLLYLDASHNRLTSIHGFNGCSSLRHINLSHNKITRVGGLETLSSLHTLLLSNNQLITTKLLADAAPTIQFLDVSHNHLPVVDGVDQLPLLQSLDARGNNLMAAPLLPNQVLLYELLLDDNSVMSVSNISKAWLPSLSHLSLAQNSLATVDDLTHCFSLTSLDLSNNQIIAVGSLLSCRNLETLLLEGNPVVEEHDYRQTLTSQLQHLNTVDGISVAGRAATTKLVSMTTVADGDNWRSVCRQQVDERRQQRTAYVDDIKSFTSAKSPNVDEICQRHELYFKASHHMAVEHRFSQEYGSTSTGISPHPPMTPKSHGDVATPVSHRGSPNGRIVNSGGEMSSPAAFVDARAKFEALLGATAVGDGKPKSPAQMNGNGAMPEADVYRIPDTVDRLSCDVPSNGVTPSASASKSSEVSNNSYVGESLPVINSTFMLPKYVGAIRNVWGNASRFPPLDISRLNKAATTIQALWRGYSLRRRLQYALNFVQIADECDLSLPDFDIEQITNGKADLLDEWTLPVTARRPRSAAKKDQRSITTNHDDARRGEFDGHISLPTTPDLPYSTAAAASIQQPPDLSHLRLAWQSPDCTYREPGSFPDARLPTFPTGKPPLPPVTRRNNAPEVLTQRTVLSKKEEDLCEEWGFKDAKTVELLLQRARRMERNAVQKKKFSQLDPKQRLAMYRKLEEISKPVVVVPQKHQPARIDYFQAVAMQEEEKKRQEQQKAGYTYEWVHTQVRQFDSPSPSQNTSSSNSMRRGSSDGNLPKIEANLFGLRARPLLGSPATVDIESLDSVSIGSSSHVQRRRSLHSEKLPPLSPLAMTSSPTQPPAAKERISWRNPQINKSTGWGGGKKRSLHK